MHILVLVTASNKPQARKIAASLVDNKLAACVNIIGAVESRFLWEGKVDQADEALLLIKSKRSKLAKIIKAVRKLHSYQVPEVIALPIVGGFNPYLKWIDDSVS